VCNQLLNNIEDNAMKAKFLEEAFRVLKPGGTLRFSFTGSESMKELASLIKGIPPETHESLYLSGRTYLTHVSSDFPTDSFDSATFKSLMPELLRADCDPIMGRFQERLNNEFFSTIILRKVK